jgi:hypothetical protein
VDFISPFGKPISKCVFIELIGILCFATNYSSMNECDAPESNKIVAGTEFVRKRIQHKIRSILSLFSCHVVHSATHVIPLTLVGLRISTSMLYLRCWLSEPLTIVFLGSLDVTIWVDAGMPFQFSTTETTIRVN